jgi:hypothetical protein
MNALHLLLASSTMALLAACTTPVAPEASLPDASRPEEIPGPTYTTTTTATLKPAPGRTFGQIAAASAGDEGAIAYTESDEEDSHGIVRNHVVLQRLDATGAVWGPRVELDTVESKGYGPPALTVATDGGRYLACWQRESSIACAGVPVGQGPAFPALSVNGAWPSLAYGSGTFALAYGVPEHVAIVRVASNGSAVGSPASFATGEGTHPRAFLAATQSGFALVDGDDGGNSNVRVHRLDSDFAPIAPPIDLGMHLRFRAAIAAYGTNVAIGLSKPYGGQIFTLDGGTVTHNHEFDAGGKGGMNVALLANEASFDMLSTYNGESGYVGPGLRYRTLQGDEVIASEQALLTEHGFDRSALAPLRLHGDLFLAATHGLLSGEIMVARVHRP